MAVVVQGMQGIHALNSDADFSKQSVAQNQTPLDAPCSMQWRTPEGVHLFGIRHLSPAGAWHIRQFLDQIKPQLVLVESPHDTEELIDDLIQTRVKPPVAALCYTSDTPIQSLLYPLARYSPEYQALLWARKHRKQSRFIDLPSNIRTALAQINDQLKVKDMQQQAEAMNQALPEAQQNRLNFYRFNQDLYKKTAELGGESDYEAYWERHFEHNNETGAYLRTVALHSAELRRMTDSWEKDADPLAASINALREAYMQRRIHEAIQEGFAPEKIVAIVGAYHVSGLTRNTPMDDAELAALPRRETRITLMPYTYYRLSSFSGYGAGNNAPYYFELLFDALEKGALAELPARYITELSRFYRQKQGYSSTAQAIEAVRLARSLQYLHGGLLPTLQDLHDAAVATLAKGNFAAIAESFAALDVGTRVGSLPQGVSRTPIQDDLYRQLKVLLLEKYRSPVAQTIDLDIRENRRAKSEATAFRDLHRSVFFNRLLFLDVGFVSPLPVDSGVTAIESWSLCWDEEVEIRVVESAIYGDTVEAATAYLLKEKLEKSDDVREVADLVKKTCNCELKDLNLDALKKLQAIGSLTEDFVGTAAATATINSLVQYGTVRRFDTQPLAPILRQLFLKAALLLYGAAVCDEDTARNILNAMEALHIIAKQSRESETLEVNDELWLAQLHLLAKADDRNPLIAGFSLALLLERSGVSDDELAIELSRRFSAGVLPETSAAWFEGLSKYNHSALLSRRPLWLQLDSYLKDLDEETFKRILVALRRAFSGFTAHEKNDMAQILTELWSVDAGSITESVNTVNAQEETALEGLKDFDLGGLL
jgi:hypothetical protein